ncbi:MAG TPA: DUF1778 domain-containing protein [Actinomycetota bacterium]
MTPYKRREDDEQRSSRIELRAQPVREARIRYAAKLQNKSMSSFILDAAAEKAEDIIASSTQTTLPSAFFDELLEALDQPPQPMPRLARAAKKPRRFTQR